MTQPSTHTYWQHEQSLYYFNNTIWSTFLEEGMISFISKHRHPENSLLQKLSIWKI